MDITQAMNRRFLMAIAALAVFSLVLCVIPLFHLLGYEYAQAILIFSMPWALALATQNIPIKTAFLQSLALLIFPLIAALINAVRVQNCNIATGLGLYALLPVIGVCYATSFGVLLTILKRQSNIRRAGLWAVGIALAHACFSAWRFYHEPPIFVFDHFWGYIPGAIYDEALGLDRRLLIFRLATLGRTMMILSITMLLAQRHRHRIIGILICLGVFFAVDPMLGSRFGYRITRVEIQTALPTVITRPGLVIHLPKKIPLDLQERIADDHAYRLAQIQEHLQVTKTPTIHSYMYSNAQEKGRLMGGHHVMFAKPWHAEIHIHGVHSPHDVMAHEMVHAVAASFGSRLLGVSARYELGINMGLVEGLATALSPERGDLDLHHWARVLMASPQKSNVKRIMSSVAFWQEAPGQAYTAAGSFIRFLLDTRGPEALKAAYRNGRLDAAYGTSLDTLIQNWLQFLETIPLEKTSVALGHDRFRHPSIFKKTCAREVALLREEARRASPAHAVVLLESVCKHLPESVDAKIDLALAKLRAGHDMAFIANAEHLCGDNTMHPTQAMRLHDALLNIFWLKGDFSRAQQELQWLSENAATLADKRRRKAQTWALNLKQSSLSMALGRYLTQSTNTKEGEENLMLAKKTYPHDVTVDYLIGRFFVNHHQAQKSLEYLIRAEKHPFKPFAFEAMALLGDQYGLLKRYHEAEETYLRAATISPSSGPHAHMMDQVARMRWYEER